MKNYIIVLSFFLPVTLFMGNPQIHADILESFIAAKVDSVSQKGLFETDEILSFTLKGNVQGLLNDRGSESKLFPFTIQYVNAEGTEENIVVQTKTRGHFRKIRGNCKLPPLLIQFAKDGSQKNTIFSEQHKLKLVMPCTGDAYVIREWLAYKMNNLVTPYSFRARLVKVKLEDEKNKKNVEPFYGILLEEEKQVAKRNNATIVENKMKPQQIKTDAFFRMAVFQYLIGNTDWSIQYRQNIKLLSPASGDSIIAVAYDFDHSGLVNAPYARPAEELQMSSVRERRFRGYCVQDLHVYDDVIAQYKGLKDEITNLISNNGMMEPKEVKSTLEWLDEFFKTINNEKAWQKDFAYPCDKNGTGNVVIKGLRED